MASIEDDPAARIVELAMEAQTRLMVAYLGQMKETMRKEVEALIEREFGGDRVYFGKGSASKLQEAHAAIRRDALPVAQGGQGLSLRALAKKHHRSKTQIARILKGGE